MKTLDEKKLSKKISLSIADTDGNDVLKGRSGDDVISARNGSDKLRGRGGDDILITYSDYGEPSVLGKQVVNQDEPLTASNDRLRGGAGADTFMWGIEIDAKPKFLEKHTQSDGRINGANNALAGENNNSHDHWVEGIGNDVVADLNLEEGDKIVIQGHTVENYKIEKKGNSYFLNLRSNQGNADQANPNGAHDGDLLGTIKLRGAAGKYSEQQIRDAITLDNMTNYVADGRGIEAVEEDTTANQRGIADGGLRIQAEDMPLEGAYKTEEIKTASGQEVITLKGGPNDDTGTASFKFSGASGQYDIRLGYYDENDGVGRFELSQGSKKNMTQIAAFDLDQELGSRFPDEKTLTTRVLSDVDVKQGELFSIKGYEDGSPSTAEHGRIDYIEFIPRDGGSMPEQPDPTSPELPMEPPEPMPEVPTDLPSSAVNLADTSANDKLMGSSENDVISARNGNDTLMGKAGDDLLISYSDAGEPPVLGKQVVNQNEPLKASNDVMTGGEGADTFMWAMEIDAKEKFLKKHTQDDGRIDGANNALAGENDNSHDHWLESIGDDVVTDLNLDEGDKIVIDGHTAENYEIEEVGSDFVLRLRSNQGNADQSDPNGAHDGDLVGTVTLKGAADKYSESQIKDAIDLDNMVNYVADGRGIEVVDADTTANRSGTSFGSMRIPAEAMNLGGAYKIEAAKAASGGELISLKGGPNDETGTASFKFEGESGQYQMKVAYFDENDGVSTLELMQEDALLGGITLDQELGSTVADEKTLTSYTFSEVNAKNGDIFTLKGYEDDSSGTVEHARVDYIEFVPMGAMSDKPSDKSMDSMMKPMGMSDMAGATMSGESDYAIAS
ncbi:MAG: hypothetical protein ACFB16_20455 [Phormidesmis sp.]